MDIVHFINDDREVGPDYFRDLEAVFAERGDVAGVGGVITIAMPPHVSKMRRRLFLLDGRKLGHRPERRRLHMPRRASDSA